MTTQQDVDRIIEVVTTLDPRAVSAEVSLLTGARLKAWNPENAGSRSATTSLPLPDKVDRWCQRKHKSYRSKIESARKLLDAAAFEQSELLVRLHHADRSPTAEALELAAEAVSPQADTCANCSRVVERTASDKLLGGRCRACYDYLKKHTIDRPRELWEKAA